MLKMVARWVHDVLLEGCELGKIRVLKTVPLACIKGNYTNIRIKPREMVLF